MPPDARVRSSLSSRTFSPDWRDGYRSLTPSVRRGPPCWRRGSDSRSRGARVPIHGRLDSDNADVPQRQPRRCCGARASAGLRALSPRSPNAVYLTATTSSLLRASCWECRRIRSLDAAPRRGTRCFDCRTRKCSRHRPGWPGHLLAGHRCDRAGGDRVRDATACCALRSATPQADRTTVAGLAPLHVIATVTSPPYTGVASETLSDPGSLEVIQGGRIALALSGGAAWTVRFGERRLASTPASR